MSPCSSEIWIFRTNYFQSFRLRAGGNHSSLIHITNGVPCAVELICARFSTKLYYYNAGLVTTLRSFPSMNIYRRSWGRYQWIFFSLYFVSRGHEGSRLRRKNYKTGDGGGGEVSHRIMIATCSFFYIAINPFFTTKEFFPHPPRRMRDSQCILYMYIVCVCVCIRWMAKHDNWEAKRVPCVVIL